MDHIVSLSPPAGTDMADDWYKMHVLLSRLLGPRIDEAANPLWNFAADPRLAGTPEMSRSRFVFVRTNTPELDALAAGIASSSFETYLPKVGEAVRFDLVCSGRTGRPGTERRILMKFIAQETGVDRIPSAGIPGNLGPQLDLVSRKLVSAGLDMEGTFDYLTDKGYLIFKGKRNEGRALKIVGLFSSGTATVRDEAALHAAILGGVGRDRTFGFGILVAQPVQERMAA